MESLAALIKFLQACITPVAMISGVGLLLLTITNRLGRVFDRIRSLVAELDKTEIKRREEKTKEITVFYKRARFLRNSVAWIMIGMISSCLIIPLLFIMSLTGIDLKILGYTFFIVSAFSMLVAFVYFFKDVLLSLNAIKLEASDYL